MKRRVYNINELMNFYGEESPCYRTIVNAVKNSELKGFQRPNGQWAINIADFDAWLNPTLSHSEYSSIQELINSW